MNIYEFTTELENKNITFQILIYSNLTSLAKNDYTLTLFSFFLYFHQLQQLDLFRLLVLITSSEAQIPMTSRAQ